MGISPQSGIQTNETASGITEDCAPRLKYVPALDGLRALAVISVLLYHANLTWIPGGFLGVEVFFVISGYLITSLLLTEWSKQGHANFKVFWLRRARRLLPALFVLLLAVTGYAVVFLPTEVATLRGDVWSSAAYVNNWYQVFSHKSYFETVGRPSLLRHMWSLAVEEQFYLIWPIVFSLLMSRLRPRQVLIAVFAGAVMSSVLMAMLYQPNLDPSRVYYGTDTRAGGLLLGATLALWWRPEDRAIEASSILLDGFGMAAFGSLIACFLLLNEFQAFLYRGGLSLTALVTAELVAVAVHPQARLVPLVLSNKCLRWVGVRSYGIYLWHFPVFMLTRPQLDVPLDGAPLLIARFALTMGIADLSYRWVEQPIRNGTLGHSWEAWRKARGDERQRWGLRWVLASGFLSAVVMVLGVFLISAPRPAPPQYRLSGLATGVSVKQTSSSNTNVSALGAFPTNPVAPILSKASSPALNYTSNAVSRISGRASAPPLIDPMLIAMVNKDGVTAIGDSVMEGVAEQLKQVLGTNVIVDADEGRLPWNTPAIVHGLRVNGKIHEIVILQIGNNGFLSSEVFGQIMAELKDARRVVVVNLKVPRHWESLNNKMLTSAIKSYPNALLVDWRDASKDQPKIFWKDGIHVRDEGAKVYAGLIVKALKSF
jgi:peptidoglycan/LPS O-acetylase OafA/YrhL